MGKPFHFALEKVLEYRRQVEDQARLALAQAKARHAAAERRLAEFRGRLAAARAKGFGPNATQPEIWLWATYCKGLERDIAAAEETVRNLAQVLQKCRREAVLRSRERKLLEKLKDRQAEKQRHAENLAEQKTFDEMSTIRHKAKNC